MEATKRNGLAGKRAGVALLAGGITLAVTLVVGAAWPIALSCSWGIAALVIVGIVWGRVGWMDAASTKAHARAEDFSRPVADASVLVASTVSLVAVGYTVITAGNREGTTKALLILLALSVVALSWVTVHTLYMLRYGDTFYRDPIGGIDFNDDDPPSYRDFAYVAFTIGMTFQVSDTSLTSKPMRRLALRHALLSFVFGAVILALTINSVASLLQ
ncbi:MAG TPA: DUF1345 domain-containing protein [Gaiellaceae bacterium]|nr:DUF1345 domain-containing protein [Gaiellaceae bacterium]